MSMQQSLTAIVVVNFGSEHLLRRNLVEVSEECPDALVVVVDNFSSADEQSRVAVLCRERQWTFVPSPDNLGFGSGMNLGVAAALAAGAERCLMLNPDARIDTESFTELESTVAASPLTLTSPVIYDSSGAIWFDGVDLYLDRGRMRATRKRTVSDTDARLWLTGACLMISRDLWDLLDGFDDRFFLYWEDVDLSFRCVEAGGNLEVVRSARAVHDEGGTQKPRRSRALSSTYYYYNTRNRLLFAALHLGKAGRRKWLATAAQEAYAILLRGGRRQLMAVAPWRAVATGTFSGLKFLLRTPTRGGRRELKVLQSFPNPRPTTNPYIVMLLQGLREATDLHVQTFTWRRALLERYDVFHAHWPEILVSGQSPLKKLLRQLFFVIFLCRLKLQKTAIVRTVHNLELPDGISRREIMLLRLFQRFTTLQIRINESADVEDGVPFETIPHGHYREWFSRFFCPPPVRGRLAYFGLIRRYKGVDRLVRAFNLIPASEEVTLSVGGRPSTDVLADELVRLAAQDPRVSLNLSYLSEAELVSMAGEAELVVLPYREMHNSGGVLAALSIGRPVLVPSNQVNQALSAETGPGWVHMYEGDIDSRDLLDALQMAHSHDTADRPNLSAREWSVGVERHLESYRRAVRIRADGRVR